MKMYIKNLTPEDYDAVLKLWELADLSSYRPFGRDSKDHMLREMKENPELFFGAFENGKLVGICIGTDDGRKGWLNRLAVHPDYRRRGIASRLIALTEEALRKRGRKIICTLIEEWNTESLQLFKKMGYEIHRDIFYLSKRENPEV
ncbi:MAG TPA: GNAT family N-acetyltransferase [Thermoplasmata archaeon]|nr:GNAT family N-acetyltransferase [Thermoplasmata archaeon]